MFYIANYINIISNVNYFSDRFNTEPYRYFTQNRLKRNRGLKPLIVQEEKHGELLRVSMTEIVTDFFQTIAIDL